MKKLRRSFTYYENAKFDCLDTNAGRKKKEKNPTLGTLLQQPKSSGKGVNHDCNLWMLYLIWKNMSGAVFKNSWILVHKA